MEKSNRTRKILSIVLFAGKRQLLLVTTTVVFMVSAAWAAKAWAGFQNHWAWFDPMLTLGTLGAALLVWLGEARQDWEQGLDQQITVEFNKDGKSIYRCERAPLIDEPPRAWAQQIGRQMNGGKDLEFWPFPKASPIHTELHAGKWVRHRRIWFELQKMPIGLKPDQPTKVWNPDNNFGQNENATT